LYEHPSKATIVMRESGNPDTTLHTRWHLMEERGFDIDEMIYENDQMSENNKGMLKTLDTIIFVFQSSVTFKNIVFKSLLDDIIHSAIYLIRGIELQNRTLTMLDVDFKNISGHIFTTFDP
jgi:hypothetical protein